MLVLTQEKVQSKEKVEGTFKYEENYEKIQKCVW